MQGELRARDERSVSTQKLMEWGWVIALASNLLIKKISNGEPPFEDDAILRICLDLISFHKIYGKLFADKEYYVRSKCANLLNWKWVDVKVKMCAILYQFVITTAMQWIMTKHRKMMKFPSKKLRIVWSAYSSIHLRHNGLCPFCLPVARLGQSWRQNALAWNKKELGSSCICIIILSVLAFACMMQNLANSYIFNDLHKVGYLGQFIGGWQGNNHML